MPIPETFKGVVAGLQSKTESGRLTWTEIDSVTLVSSLQTQSVRLRSKKVWPGGLRGRLRANMLEPVPDPSDELTLEVLDDEGLMVDEFSLQQDDHDFETLKHLWQSARRSARGVTQALLELEEALKAL